MTTRQLFARNLRGWVAPADCYAAFYAEYGQSFWFDREAHAQDRFSVIGDADSVVEFALAAEGIHPLEKLQQQFADSVANAADIDLPFDWRPGIVFALAYDPESISRAMSVSRGMVFDHDKRQMWFVVFC